MVVHRVGEIVGDVLTNGFAILWVTHEVVRLRVDRGERELDLQLVAPDVERHADTSGSNRAQR